MTDGMFTTFSLSELLQWGRGLGAAEWAAFQVCNFQRALGRISNGPTGQHRKAQGNRRRFANLAAKSMV